MDPEFGHNVRRKKRKKARRKDMMGFVTQVMSEADRKKFDDEAKQLLLKQLEYQRGL